MAGRFRTTEVAELYRELGGRGHPEHPFLDPHYSPGGYYPVTDFTMQVAQWMAEWKLDAIMELWSFIGRTDDAGKQLLKRALATRIDNRWGIDDASAIELLAINLLGARMSMQDNTPDCNSTAYVVTELAATRLASITWVPPTGLVDILRDNAAKEANVEDGPDKRIRKMKQAAEAIEELLREMADDVKTVGQWMLLIPPMARLVVLDYFTRGWGPMALRPELYYSERQYGCCAELNLHYIRWVGCFEDPTDDSDARKVTKAHLIPALEGLGLDVKKSAKRAELVELARQHPGTIAALIRAHAPTYVRPKREWLAGLEGWMLRWKKLRCVAAALLSVASQQALLK